MTTVISYVSQAISQGLGYDWARLAGEIDTTLSHGTASSIIALLRGGASHGRVKDTVHGAEYWMIKLVQVHLTRLNLLADDQLGAPPEAPGTDEATRGSGDVSEFRIFFV